MAPFLAPSPTWDDRRHEKVLRGFARDLLAMYAFARTGFSLVIVITTGFSWAVSVNALYVAHHAPYMALRRQTTPT